MSKGLSTISLHRSVRSASVHTGVTEVMAEFIGVVTWLGSASARAHQRDGLDQAVATPYASHGSRTDRSCVDAARSAAVSGTAMATASGSVSKAVVVGHRKGR